MPVRSIISFSCLTALLVACSSASDAPAATASLKKVSGDNQSGAPGTPLPNPLVVKVADALGAGVVGVPVIFTIIGGEGSFFSVGSTAIAVTVNSTTDGTASSPVWALGLVAGPNTVTATAAGYSGSPATFTASAVAGLPAAIQIYSGNNQTGPVNTELVNSPLVKVVDSSGQPVAGVSVTFAVTSGGGFLEDDAVHTTGPTGLTFARGWVLGGQAGTNTLTATITGTNKSVIFTATGR